MKPATNPGGSSVPDTSAQPLLTGDLCFPTEIHKGDLILTSGTFCVKGKDFSLLGSIELSGTATLIIEDSIFRHLAEYSGGVKLTASGNARVEIQNSIIVSNKVDPAPQNGNNEKTFDFNVVEADPAVTSETTVSTLDGHVQPVGDMGYSLLVTDMSQGNNGTVV